MTILALHNPFFAKMGPFRCIFCTKKVLFLVFCRVNLYYPARSKLNTYIL